MPIAIMALVRLGPRMATTIIASNRYGKASSTSTVRMITASARRPKYPEMTPRITPSSAAMPSATTPTTSAMRAP